MPLVVAAVRIAAHSAKTPRMKLTHAKRRRRREDRFTS